MTLDVLLHGRHVGVLEREPASGVVAFTLADDYFLDRTRPVLGQMFEERRRQQRFRQTKSSGQLPAFFANVMPEGALKTMIEAQTPGEGALGLLARIGADLPGAVVIRASKEPSPARAVVRTYDEPGAAGTASANLWRFSLAGIQLKMSAAKDRGGRFTLPFSHADGRWILKFGSREYPSLPENEFTVMNWAYRSGLDVPPHQLVDARTIDGLEPGLLEFGEKVFAIERYDRVEGGARIHQEDLAQVFGLLPERKYEHATYEGMAGTIGALCGIDDLREFLRRVVFMVLSGNVDAHLKNWSIVYPDQRHPRLSPAYDLVFVMMYPRIERLLALKLAGEKVPAAIQWRHIERIEQVLRAKGLEAPVVDDARAFVARALDAWAEMRSDVETALADTITGHLATIQLTKK